MSEKAAAALEIFKSIEGQEEGVGEWFEVTQDRINLFADCLLYTSPSPRDQRGSRMPSSA